MANNYPILLAHGIARFDYGRNKLLARLRPLFGNKAHEELDGTHYFKGIANHLRDERNFRVYHSSVPFAAELPKRGKQLAIDIDEALDHSGASKIHIIGHSMGGMDGRWAIVREGMANKVASLTTVGTPHNGTSVADVAMAHGADDVIEVLEELMNLKGFLDLTRGAAREFNDDALKAELTNDVVYHTYSSHQQKKALLTPLRLSSELIRREEGDNDGLVAVSSQRWTPELHLDGARKKIHQHVFPRPADHLNQVGWWDLSELRALPWRQRNPFTAKKKFEAAIQAAYLDMAITAQKI